MKISVTVDVKRSRNYQTVGSAVTFHDVEVCADDPERVGSVYRSLYAAGEGMIREQVEKTLGLLSYGGGQR